MMALENIDVLRQNGFEIEADEEVDAEESRRIKLLSIPVSKSIVFDVKGIPDPHPHDPLFESCTHRFGGDCPLVA